MKFRKLALLLAALLCISAFLLSCTDNAKKNASNGTNTNENTGEQQTEKTESDKNAQDGVKYVPSNEKKDGEEIVGDDNEVSVSQWDIESDTKNSPSQSTTKQQSVQSADNEKLSSEEAQKLKDDMLKMVNDLKE